MTSARLPVPVVVIGNVVVGGAGKTPTVMATVLHLQMMGWRPGVISRGHGRASDAPQVVEPHSDAALVGDEPRLVAQATGAPVVVARQRVLAGRHLLRRYPEVNVIVSDDGMQHWPLARDLTVVVFDARQTGNGWLLPAGLLREPWPAKPLAHEPLLVLSTAPGLAPHSLWPTFYAPRRLAGWAINPQGARRPLADFCGHGSVGALAGIAQPDAFFDMLRNAGITLTCTRALVDHASAVSLQSSIHDVQDTGAVHTWLCTEKDAIKLFPVLTADPTATTDVWAVPLEQTPEPAFFAALDAALVRTQGRDQPVSSAHGHKTA